ncbi:hypothetical protein EYC84_008624 [Monilinia fructicola]|uniref:Uncharacterized protein n=1 Tax=Monilinia fructicola TaxID=38448 RepID=A0A5M9JFU1_MONFR|nr:hypothetical protein EYC84_008624 [Monilinia fructicola]
MRVMVQEYLAGVQEKMLARRAEDSQGLKWPMNQAGDARCLCWFQLPTFINLAYGLLSCSGVVMLCCIVLCCVVL